MIRNYQKDFGKSKSVMEHQKLHGKLSEYIVLTIQTVLCLLCLLCLNEKYEIATYKGDRLLTLFEMDLFEAANGWGGAKRPPL